MADPVPAEYWGLYTQEGQRLPFADQVQYLVLPVRTCPARTSRCWTSISRQFVAVGQGWRWWCTGG